MKFNYLCIIVICFAVIFCFLAGCTGDKNDNGQITGTGAHAIVENQGHQKKSLDDVFSEINVMNSERADRSNGFRAFAITGFKPDSEGKSESWMVVGTAGNQSEFIDYRDNSVTINNWYGKIPKHEILENSTTRLSDVLIKHQARLREYRDAGWTSEQIDLRDGVYNLTLQRNSDSKVFSFDAKSGEFIGWN
jgi:hypothetical protein